MNLLFNGLFCIVILSFFIAIYFCSKYHFKRCFCAKQKTTNGTISLTYFLKHVTWKKTRKYRFGLLKGRINLKIDVGISPDNSCVSIFYKRLSRFLNKDFPDLEPSNVVVFFVYGSLIGISTIVFPISYYPFTPILSSIWNISVFLMTMIIG